MKVKVFVNWGIQEVCSEKDLEERIKEKTADIYEDTDAFEEFLEREVYDTMTLVEIFEMSAEHKEKIIAEWKDKSSNYAKDEIEEDWEEFDLEI